MTLAELKKKSAALPVNEQQELVAFLATLRMQQSGEGHDVTDTKTRNANETFSCNNKGAASGRIWLDGWGHLVDMALPGSARPK